MAALGLHSVHLPKGIQVLLLHPFLSFSPSLPLPSAIHFPLPMLHFLLSFSKTGPKSSFWIQRWSGFMGPLPTGPIPTALARGMG